jgi:glycosyltransferase involved in cell wall biosynthesis
MAAGAAVVGSATGGIPETVRGAGVLVPPGSVDALAQVIEGLADSPEEVARWSDAGISRARSRTWSAVRDELDDRIAPFVGQGPVDRRTR